MKREFKVTLPNGIEINHLTYQEALNYVQEFEDAIVEEVCTED